DSWPSMAPDGSALYFASTRSDAPYTDIWRARFRPTISAPTASSSVRGTLLIRGTAASSQLIDYTVAFWPSAATSWETLATSTRPAIDTTLAMWDTRLRSDG